jgi:hypothetical protein
LSATQTLVFPTVTRARPDEDGEPEMSAVPLEMDAVIPEEDEVAEVELV